MNCHESFISNPPGRIKAVLPDDFAQHADSSTNDELARRYGVGRKVLARWRKEANTPASAGRFISARNAQMPVPNDFRDYAPRLTNRALGEKFGVGEKTITRWRKETGLTAPITAFRNSALPKTHVPPPPSGRANEAAQFLRPTHRPVYHRIIDGKQYEGQYVCGTRLLSSEEIIAYAEERGFKPMNDLFRSRFADV